MKKLLTAALIAAMTLAMGVPAFALGNFVTSTDELESEAEIEVPEERTEEEQEPAAIPVEKPNPNTGAGNIDGLAAVAVVLTAAGAIIMKKK